MEGVLSLDTEALIAFARCRERHADNLLDDSGPAPADGGARRSVDAVRLLHADMAATSTVMGRRMRSTSVAVQVAAHRFALSEHQRADAFRMHDETHKQDNDTFILERAIYPTDGDGNVIGRPPGSRGSSSGPPMARSSRHIR